MAKICFNNRSTVYVNYVLNKYTDTLKIEGLLFFIAVPLTKC